MAKGIYKRGDVYWIQYAGLGGLVHRESSKSKKYRDAEDLLIKRKQQVREGKLDVGKRISKITLSQLAESYLSWAERQRSFRSKKGYVKQLLQAFGAYPLRQIAPIMVEQFQSRRLQEGNKPATVNRLLATLKHMYTKAVEWDMVEESALRRIHKVRLLEENNKRIKYLSREESSLLCECCDPHIRPIVLAALNTGMRKEEILGLTWDNVDLRHGFIHLLKTKNGERREIPINATLGAALKGIMRRLDVQYVFHDPTTGKRYMDIKKGFQRALRRAGIVDFRFHDLRHTFASQLVMAGADLRTVQEILGHKSMNMTLRYAHLAPSHKAKAVKLLDEIPTNITFTSQSKKEGAAFLG